MSLARLKTWISNEILTASALNAEFNNIINNASSLISPCTASFDLDGNTFIMDGAGATTVVSSTSVSWNFSAGSKAGTPGTTGSVANWSAQTYTDSNTAGSGTATAFTAHAFQRPTLAATNASVVTTDAATVYIANSPLASTNETITKSWALWTDDGAVRHDLTQSVVSSAGAVLRSMYLPAVTATISGSTNITTATGFNQFEIGQPTLSAGTALTVTNAATVYIADAPTGAGAGPATITNPYALWVDNGATRLDGSLTVNGASTLTGTATVIDGNFSILGSSDATKKLAFEVDTNVPTATTLTITPGQGQILPAGIGPLPYSGSSIPTGWLECDGSSVLRATYPALFTAIGTTWGSADGTHFTLPDMRGRVAICDGTGTVVEACTASSSNGFTVVSNATKWNTGQTVVLSNLASFTTSATAGPTYFVVRISATNIRLATTLALAQNLTPDVTISGSGTVTVTGTLTARTLGQNGGQETHAITSDEDLAHTHTENIGPNTGGNSAINGQATSITGTQTTSSFGGNTAMNIMQPFIVTKYIISY